MNVARALDRVEAVLAAGGQGLAPGQRRILELELGSAVSRDLIAIQAAIGDWQMRTFPGGGEPIAIMATQKKFEQEARDLMLALTQSDYKVSAAVADGIADCLIVLLGMAARLRIDAHAEISGKMATNKARSWPSQQTPGQPVSHIKETI